MSGSWEFVFISILLVATHQGSTGQQSLQAGPHTSSVTLNNEDEPGQISRRMCAKYGQEIPDIENISSLLKSKQFDASICRALWNKGRRIFGGVIAAAKEFPHMAHIGYGSERIQYWICGGSLISERFVLTAAHCLKSVGLDGVGIARWVRIGGISIQSEETEGLRQEFSVEQRIYHPEYLRPAQYNDIGLLRLDHDVVFNAFARPACLHVDKDIPVQSAVATGWGKTQNGRRSDSLLKVTLSIESLSLCNRTFIELDQEELSSKLRNGLEDETMICAGNTSGGKDTCAGDSGGPLQFHVEEPFCMISIIGVTSFGRECGQQDTGAIYTRVSNYVPWIETIVWPKDNEKK